MTLKRRTVTGIILTLILTSMLMLEFNIRQVKAQGVIYIRPDGSLDPPMAAIQRNGDIYTFTENIYDPICVDKSDVLLDGAGFILEGPGTASEARGIKIMKRGNITITDVTITGWSTGIYIEGSSNNTIIENNIANSGIGISVGGFPGVSQCNIVSRNQITNNEWGVVLSAYAHYNTISLSEISNNARVGIYISGDFAEGNIIFANNIIRNVHGIEGFTRSSDNRVYHNNFIDNNEQVYSRWGPYDGVQVWDDGYPSGGNYWSDYTDVDLCNGPNQDLSGMDGIWDHPYIIDVNNRDRYPLVRSWPTIPAAADVDPDTLNLRSSGKWIAVSMELPTRYDVNNIEVSTIMLNDTFTVDFTAPTQIGDYDLDGIPDLMVKFNRTQLESYLYSLLGIKYGSVTLKIAGKLLDGTPFEGTAVIFVIYAGDVNGDGAINILDTAMVGAHWYPGPPIGLSGYNADTDLNDDGIINILDSGMFSSNWTNSSINNLLLA